MLKYAFFTLILFTQLPLSADVSQAEKLEKQNWEYIKNHKWEDLEKNIAPYFQYSQFDVNLNKEQYLNREKTLNVGDATFSDLKVTESPGFLIVTYNLQASETVEGRPLSTKAKRLTVWQENNKSWQMIAHAVFIPVPPPLSKAKQTNKE
jgi:hypothetical protein